jgi:sec-independent protein translocase protein TatC
LVRVELLTSATLISKWKYAVVIAFIVAAVLTPPDPISQLGLAIPTLMLYGVAIIAAQMIEKSRSRQAIEDKSEE